MNALITTALTAAISSTIGAIVAAIVSKIKVTRKKQEQDRQDAEDLKLMITQNTIMTCRIAIYDEHFSIDEKLEAYKIYRDRGGNHQTKTYMDKLVGGDVDEYLEKHGL